MFLSGPRTYEPVADEAAPDHEDDLSGLKKLYSEQASHEGSLGVELLQHVGEGGVASREDHEPSDPELQEVHHREWKSHHLEPGQQ